MKGTARGSNVEGTDFCGIRTVPEFSEPINVDSCEKMERELGKRCKLYEWACGESPEFDETHAIRFEYECPNGCQDGACITVTTTVQKFGPSQLSFIERLFKDIQSQVVALSAAILEVFK